MTAPRLPGTCQDSTIKRLYLARLQAAQARYDAAMKRSRRLLRGRRAAADLLMNAGRVDEAEKLAETAFARFERARDRSERNRDRVRRRAARWLRRQKQPEAFRRIPRSGRSHLASSQEAIAA